MDSTRDRILLAAGKLFAQKGLEGTGVREIVREAGTTLSSVNYHFGTKKDLYVEVVRHVLAQRAELDGFLDCLSGASLANPQEVSNALCKSIRTLFVAFLAPHENDWYGPLATRALFELDSSDQVVFNEALAPTTGALRETICRHCPAVTPEDADLWIIAVYAQVHHYALTKRPILNRLGKDDYDLTLLDRMARFTARGFVMMLPGLPAPENCGS